jgi:haloacetate dehalogenase
VEPVRCPLRSDLLALDFAGAEGVAPGALSARCAPKAAFDNPFGHGSFGPDILEEYVSTYRDPACVHGICEEYRAAATIDVEHDRVDKETSKRIECPMLHLWAERGPLDTFYAKDGGPLGIWRQWAPHAQGQAMKGGHFFPEENPDDTAVLVKQFLSA